MSIEQKIAEILAESKQDEAVIEEPAVETEDEVVAEAADAEEVVAEESVEEAYGKKKMKEADCDDDDDDEDEVVMKKESKHKMKKEETETEDEMIVDVKEDVAALVNGEDLSEEFKTKAATIFEAAIVTRVKALSLLSTLIVNPNFAIRAVRFGSSKASSLPLRSLAV